MERKNKKEKVLAWLTLIGGLLALGSIGGMQTDVVGPIGGTFIFLAGVVVIFVVIWIYNRKDLGKSY